MMSTDVYQRASFPRGTLSTNVERAWEGQVQGRHWIATVVQIDEDSCTCDLYVACGAQRDRVPASVNCRWDYEFDHILNRFVSDGVPPEVTCEMRAGLREWFDDFQRRQRTTGLGTDGAVAL